ncbi:MAG: iron hydrogenase small subunit, partial [Clostridiales bacterium]|nr:iron hydrogenase small subunit [Clostridiales bacterium]
QIIEQIKSGEKHYDFVEIMACPGGCINGGGQPVQSDSVRNYTALKGLRAKVLYDADKKLKIRRSHENPVMKQIYDEFFDSPGKPRAHKLLHTRYIDRNKQ